MTDVIAPCPFPKRYPSALKRDDAHYMSLAYNQAIDAWNQNEVPIGAVLVTQGQVIAAAHNAVESQCDPTAHAEMLTITQGARALQDWRLVGTTLYVTKEPCAMCTGALILGRVARVVYALSDPKAGCMGGAQCLHELAGLNHRVSVTASVLEPECRALIQAFFQLKRAG